MEQVITTAHGSGGRATAELIRDVFAERFHNELDDAAVLPAGGEQIALTTDSFVVTPPVYAGGDIGRLSVCGTVNDLLMRGAKPLYLTAGFIIEEGVTYDLLRRIVSSMADTAAEAGVRIAAGDTKVVEGGGRKQPELYINTAGVGLMGYWKDADGRDYDIGAAGAKPGDRILISGTMGDHHAAILGARMNISVDAVSDNAPLTEMVSRLLEEKIRVRTMRDITRGGLATVLKELALSSGRVFRIAEEAVPVSAPVRGLAGMMGLDPLYFGNEGKMAVIVAAEDADRALDLMKESRYGAHACAIGSAEEAGKFPAGTVLLKTAIGGLRNLDVLQDEGLPRIC